MKAVFATAGALIAVCALVHPAVADAPCVPSAAVTGDAALVAEVVIHLDDMGVHDDTPAGSCPHIEATVAHSGTAVTVSVRDSYGNVETRSVTDARIAATWIQSWCRTDIRAPLLAPPKPSTVVAAVTAPATNSPAVVRDVEPSLVVATETDRRLTTGVMYESIDADDDTSWTGVSASGCVLAAGVCLGAIARYATNPEVSANDGLTLADRSSTELLATAGIPFTIGRATVIPTFGAGVGRLHTSRNEPAYELDPDGNVDPCANMPDEMCPPIGPPFYIGDGFNVSHWGMRLEAQVTLSVPLARSVFLDLGAGMSVMPGAHKDVYAPPIVDDPEVPPDPDPTMDPNAPPTDPAMDDPFVDSTLWLPGEPEQMFRIAIGLRIGLP